MTCAEVIIDPDCPEQVEVLVEDAPEMLIDCCEQGPPGPPGTAEFYFPFYLADGTLESIQVVGGKIPFYLSDGTLMYLDLTNDG